MAKVYQVLVLCTGNSARSVMAEGLINVMGQGRFRAYSAGSKPSGRVQPMAIEQLQTIGYDTSSVRSKSWDEFSEANPDAPRLDMIITVCDNAAGETCPVLHGVPLRAHWSFPDPGLSGSEEERRADFTQVFRVMMHRVDALVNLPLSELSPQEMTQQIKAIATITSPADEALLNKWIKK